MSGTDVAFFMCGLVQGVIGAVWLVGAWAFRDVRQPALHWAAFGFMSTLSFALLAAALHATPEYREPLRAAGNILGVSAALVLQRGIWVFIEQKPNNRAHALLLAGILILAVVGLNPALGYLRVAGNSVILVITTVWTAFDLSRHARLDLGYRHPWALGLPLLGGAVGYGYRGLEALLLPPSVGTQMTTNSLLNVVSSFSYVLLTIVFHATLMALVVSGLIQHLRRLSSTDGLTGLMNRRAMDAALAEQVEESGRTGEAFTVLVCDLDHFKAINDTFGHAVGDLALKHVSTVLRGALRQTDLLARYGGEEFLIVAPRSNQLYAMALAQRVCAQVAESPLQRDQTPIRMSISVGFAEWAEESVDQLVTRADDALYRAKHEGRGRAVAAPNRATPPNIEGFAALSSL